MSAPALEGFDDLALSEAAVAALRAMGIGRATAVQAGAFPPILAGRNTLLHATTGSGKTLAYLLPVLARLRDPEAGRAVIVAPGTELAMQTLRVADALKPDDLASGSAIATTSARRQRERVQRSTRLVVGTPDRVFELFVAGKLKGARLLVLDELEPILTAQGSGVLNQLLSRSEPSVQLVVASATLGPRSTSFLERFLGAEGVTVAPPASALTDSITHHVVRVAAGRSRDLAIARFLQEYRCRRAIVFVRDPGQASHLFHFLAEHGHRPVTVTHHRSKADRQAGLRAFRDGDAHVLILSDATGRGLDLPGVAWVLHYDLPRAAQVYAHRAGRTGRAGAHGTSVVFADDTARTALRRLGQELGHTFTPPPDPRDR